MSRLTYSAWTDEQVEALRVAALKGRSDDELAKITGHTASACRHRRQSLGIYRHSQPLSLSASQEEAVAAAMRAGWGVARIAREAGLSYDQLRRAVARMKSREAIA